jgi:hypothetical protein
VLSGEAPPFLEWLREKPLADLTLGPPDLETLFREFYQEDGS